MNYRHLGRSGIQVSELSFGSWVTFGDQVDVKAAVDMMSAAYEAGVNFFDNAEAYGYGSTTWSPLASGLLSGKYKGGIPKDSRATLKGYDWLRDRMTDKERLAKVEALEPIANELGCTLSQLAIAWCLKNPFVSTVITCASRLEQVHENMKASEVAPKITEETLTRIDQIFGIQKEEEED